jgi:phenylalanyl-tRNA synthetase alpha chain
MKLQFTEEQWKIYELLLNSNEVLDSRDIVARLGVDHSLATSSLNYGLEQEWLTIDEKEREELIPADDALDILEKGLPERAALSLIPDVEGKIKIRDLVGNLKKIDAPLNEVIKWGKLRGWLDKVKDEIVLQKAGTDAILEPADDEKAIRLAFQLKLESPSIFLDELAAHSIDGDAVKTLLKNRPQLAKIKPRTFRYAKLTEKGREILGGDVQIVKEKNLLSSEDIVSGEWRNIKLRRYDVGLEAEKVFPAKVHPLQRIIQQTRKAFLEMGFTEVVSPQVESAFWDFDALFQPQDHPARDMQDTFYLEEPSRAMLPDNVISERVKRTHEDGWETGSKGWGYKWSAEKARQTVLRTHTTASSIRALCDNPKPPRKVFCVGKVFRNEAISYKHLPEFFQVDGIIVDEGANLATLLGTLKEFYSKMGFDKVKFKPSFFPYTEPSVEVFVFMESKNQWLELGGSGIFRPEVTVPFGCNVPVLAWGLGLERLAMMRYGIKDIRELYWSDLDETKEIALCQ